MPKAHLEVRLFGRLSVRYRGEPLLGRAPRKVQELLAYLCLNQERVCRRDDLAGLLWGRSDPDRARRYLRQALWSLQKELGSEDHPLIEQDRGWVKTQSPRDLWVDVQVLREAWQATHGVKGESVGSSQARALSSACAVYHGDLLEGWYSPWCLAERDRLRETYLAAEAKLADYHESRRQYDLAVDHVKAALQRDWANESMHRVLMRLLYLSGDRTGALRQYERCRAAMKTELGIEPGKETNVLYAAIQSDRMLEEDDS